MLQQIAKKLEKEQRLTCEDALFLYKNAPLEWLQEYSFKKKKSLYGDKVFYNRNIHFEPTNRCIYSCKFCSFYRKPNAGEKEGAWDYSLEDLEKVLQKYDEEKLTEIHITGGVHPTRGIQWAEELLGFIKKNYPFLHIKAFTAVEIVWLCKVSKLTIEEGLRRLKEVGLNSLPGGGAEIFDKEIRRKIAGGKAPANRWLEVHQIAHNIGLSSNATMLYGHIESYEHRVGHMKKIRDLQDKTGGFNAFIPLRYRNENNSLSHLKEIPKEEDLRNYSIGRLYLDNIGHLKAYWVMLGVDIALESLQYGVDDLDGTIDDSTKIYSMAGSIANPSLSSQNLENMITKCGGDAVERNSLYEEIRA